jgi:MFS family permease
MAVESRSVKDGSAQAGDGAGREAPPNGSEKMTGSSNGRALLTLSGCVVLLWAVMMSVFPALPKISAGFGISSGDLGLVLTGSALVMTVLNVPAGVLADRFGRRPPILVGLALSALSILLASLPFSGWSVFAVSWILFGVGRGLFLSPSFTVPVDLFPPQSRGKAVGFLAGGIGLGSVLGYVYGGLLLTVGSWRVVLGVDAGLLAAAALVAALLLPESSRARQPSTLGAAFATTLGWFSHRTVVLSGLAAGITFAVGIAATFVVPFSLTALHASSLLIATIFVPYEIVASVGTNVAGSLSDRIGRVPVLGGCVVIVTVALVLLPVLGVSAWSIAVIYSLVGLAEGPAISMTTTLVADEVVRTDPMRVGSALGANRLVQGIGPVLGPVLGGFLVGHAGAKGQFWILGAGCLVALAFVAPLRASARRAVVA